MGEVSEVRGRTEDGVSGAAPVGGAPRLPRRPRARFVRRHWLFLALVAVGVVARGLVIVAYPPALMYLGDSAAYLDQAWRDLWPGDWRPSGYPVFLRMLDGPDHLTRLVVAQHLLTLLAAVALYAVALRALRRPWLAAVAAAPALLAPWVLDLGQFVLADSLFGTLVTLGVALLARPGRPRALPCALAGLLLGAGPCVRTVGYGPLAVGLVVLLSLALSDRRRGRPGSERRGRRGRRDGDPAPPEPSVAAATVAAGAVAEGTAAGGNRDRHRHRSAAGARGRGRGASQGRSWGSGRDGGRGWPRSGAFVPALAFVLAAAAPILAYSGWSASEGKGFSVSSHSGFFLYGRVAPFVDCAAVSRPDLRTLCDPRPVDERGAPVRYLWPADSPLRQGHRLIPPGREKLAGEFAGEAVRDQPWMLVTSSARYLVGYLSPVPYVTAKTSRADTWELPSDWTNVVPDDDPHSDDGYFVATEVDDPPAGWLAAYSRASYAPMPLVGLGLLAGLLATPVAWLRGRRNRRPDQPGAGTGLRLFWLAGGSGVSTLVLAALTAGFDYRYLGAVIGPVGLAAVVGLAAFAGAVRHRPAVGVAGGPVRTPPADAPDQRLPADTRPVTVAEPARPRR